MQATALSPTQVLVTVFVLTALSVGGLLFAVLAPAGDRSTRMQHRLDRAVKRPKNRSKQAANAAETRRKRMVEETLKDLEEKQKAKAANADKPTLKNRLKQSGLTWNKSTYFLICLTVGTVTFLLPLLAFRIGPLPSLGFGFAGGLALPHLYVSRKRNVRFKKFSAEFPNALDVITRGVKSGIPLIDCLKTIAEDAQEPVKSEFTEISEDQTVGVPLEEAIQRMATRIPLSEANFFAIVISIQSRTGGNLSEALGNLSNVLRDRKNLRGKIKAMSAEAKASAGIIGSMPVVVTLLLYFVSPDYISLLATTTVGNVVSAAALLWMGIGVLVMRNMINFEL